ncbi:MAG: glycosyltransferase [Candidatus Brocadiaceae bacterium]|nr:glycosyltransferase [Candidatus Brocadiaceae bacterium]
MIWLMDCVYLAVGAFLLPFWLLKIPTAPRYRAGILQRLGLSPRLDPGRRRLWIHCASVGEAAIPTMLVADFRRRFPDWQIVFSTNTDTGAARLRELHPGATVFYLPLDLSPCVALALRRIAPTVLLLVELEFWPNLTGACAERGVPIGIINGRITGGSQRMLKAMSRLWPRLWRGVSVCCARGPDDAEGFIRAGLARERVFDCGMLKCDQPPAEPLPEELARLQSMFQIAAGAPVLVAGSTRVGEESILAAAYRDLISKYRRLRMIVVPRHVERAREAVAAVRGRGLPAVTKTDLDLGRATADGTEVIVVDTIGELSACYALATVTFVGGSLLPPGGGQNVMEAAALGKPVLTGPYTTNFRTEVELLRAAGTAVLVRTAADLVDEVDRLLLDPVRARGIGAAGRRTVERNRGASERTFRHVEKLATGGLTT